MIIQHHYPFSIINSPLNNFLVCVGSNDHREESMAFARSRLKELYPSVHFEPEVETLPIGIQNPALFLNQVAMFTSDEEIDEIKSKLKEIEKEAGRCPEDKKSGKVRLDIDLIVCGEQILKPEDWDREYVKRSRSAFLEYNTKNRMMDKNRKISFLGIIPARYASTRFPAKPLAMLGGKTVIQRVYEQVAGVLDDAYVATDDERIEAAVKAFGGKVVMTSVDHKSGTDRCYEACMKVGGDFDVVVNIQGDEPFIQPSQLVALQACFEDTQTQIATLVKPFSTEDSFEVLENVNSPKVVVNKNWNALYFSRSIIPYQRNAAKREWLKNHTYYKHIGLYAYRTEVLKEITTLVQSSLELAESLEQLRWLENGYTIKVGISDVETIGIDTPEDLQRAEEFLKNR